MRQMTVLFLAVFVLQPYVIAPTIYVSTTGNDVLGCGSSLNPCKTISFAVTQASEGYTILVKAGIYYDEILIDSTTFLGNTLTIVGKDYPTVIGVSEVFKISSKEVDIVGFKIRDGKFGIYYANARGKVKDNVLENNVTGIYLENSYVFVENNQIMGGNEGLYLFLSDSTIHENRIQNNGLGISVSNSSPIVQRNEIFKNETGFYASDSTPIFMNNIVAENSIGIQVVQSTAQIFNNTIDSNSLDGIELSSSVAEITNNIISNNKYGIEADSTSESRNTYNDLWNNGINYIGTSQGVGEIFENPMFVQTLYVSVIRDYHLSSKSPCIDAGAEIASVVDDMDGDPRPMGKRYDIGADEFRFFEVVRPGITERLKPFSSRRIWAATTTKAIVENMCSRLGKTSEKYLACCSSERFEIAESYLAKSKQYFVMGNYVAANIYALKALKEYNKIQECLG